MPTLSFIIPVLNENENIMLMLDVLNRQFPGMERVFVDGGSVDGTRQTLQDLGERCIESEPGRAQQMNAAAAMARGDYLLFLHADTRPLFSADTLLQYLVERPVWGFCPVTFYPSTPAMRVIAWFMNRRSRYTGVGTGDQMLWVRRDVFEAENGYADIPLMEDVELSKRLRRQYWPSVLSHQVETSDRRWQEKGVLRTVLTMWSLRLAYFCGVSPQRLHQYYYKS